MAHIAEDADHATAAVLGHALPNWVLSGPEGVGQRFVDHDDGLTRRRVLFSEIASGAQGNADSLKVSFAHHPDETLGFLTSFINPPFRRDLPASIASQGQHI